MITVKLYLYTACGPLLHEQRAFSDRVAALCFERQRGQELATEHLMAVSGALHVNGSSHPSGGGYYRPRF